MFKMKRFTAYVSGKVQKAGYRARVVDFARAFGLKGTVQNLDDGRVKIIAEGPETDLERFLKAIDIKNTTIYVSTISVEYSNPSGDYEAFYKQVNPGETDSRLDQGVVVLKEILGAIQAMHADLGSKQDQTLSAIKDMHSDLGNKIDSLGNKIDDSRADIVGEVRELRKDIKEGELVQMKNDIAEIKIKLKLEP
jgi:acylphosphatase